jgi:hypothetical protein
MSDPTSADPTAETQAAPLAAAEPPAATADSLTVSTPGAAPGKPLTEAARRALEEAAARREAASQIKASHEDGGPAGLEPTRFGDWERKGLAVDF